jgi:hydrogenase maturation protease
MSSIEHRESFFDAMLYALCFLGGSVAGRTVVIGVGNLLLRDEGVGIHAVQELQKRTLPPGVEVIDGGVAGIRLLDFFSGAQKLLLIDAAEMGLEPGSVVRFTPEDVRFQSGALKLSTHDVALPEVLALARTLNQCPSEIIIFGIQPEEISWGTELTPEVRAAVFEVVELVLKEIDPAGTELARRKTED